MGIGCKIGNRNVQPYMAPSFVATSYSTNTCLFYWTVPQHGLFDGVMVRYNTNGTYPKTIHEGTLALDNTGVQIALTNTQTVLGRTVSGFTTGTTYYFSCFPFYINGDGDKVYNGRDYKTAVWTAENFANSTSITGTSNWTVPRGVRTVEVFVVGGGGGGGGTANSYTSGISGSGGGGSGYTSSGTRSVTPGEQYYCYIGSGGSGGWGGGYPDQSPNSADGGNGGTTTFYHGSGNISASGGYGGKRRLGGGAGGAGGANGGGGDWWGSNAGGTGQSFNGVTYNGGGGGGGKVGYGAGGYRGGGHGAMGDYFTYIDAEAGWGGTGGGGGGGSGRDTAGGKYSPSGAWGGSGVIVIKWS